MLRVVILNDTRRNRGHIGCLEVMSNIEFLAQKNSLAITASYQETDAAACPYFERTLSDCDIVIVNGEGTLHHDQAEAIDLLKAVRIAHSMGKPCHLINCSWEANNHLNQLLPLLSSIFVRDSRSRDEIRNAGFSSVVTPDLSLYSTVKHAAVPVPTRQLTFIDSVRWKTTKPIVDAASAHRENLYVMDRAYWRRMKYAPAHLKLLLRGRRLEMAHIHSLQGLVVTGRFHGMCLAIKCGTPFIAIPSNTMKMEATVADIGLASRDWILDRASISKAEILRAVSSRKSLSREAASMLSDYRDHAQTSIESMFSSIRASV